MALESELSEVKEERDAQSKEKKRPSKMLSSTCYTCIKYRRN